MRITAKPILAAMLLAALGCDSDDASVPGAPDEGEVTFLEVEGQVIDFATGEPLEAQATITTDGLEPAPTVAVDGADFVLTGVTAHSVFHVLAGAPPTHRSTYNPALDVRADDLGDVKIYVLGEDYLAGLADAFGVTPASGQAVLLARVVDGEGTALAGVPAAAFSVPAGAKGPYFLDADRQAAPAADATSASGWVVLFDVAPGLVEIGAAPAGGLSMTMAASPVAGTAATMADIVVEDADAEEPIATVSFANDVAPVFERRGCLQCHYGGGIGRDLGGLHLNGAANKMYTELMDPSPLQPTLLRVNTEEPEASLLLTMPSREDPADRHPNVTFASASDDDYRLILAWISQGASNN